MRNARHRFALTGTPIENNLGEVWSLFEFLSACWPRLTDAVLDEVREWQNRPLDAVYPVVFFDAMRVKIRDEGLVKNKAVYVALALNPDGEKDVLGLWIEQTEGAKFWLKVVNDSRRAASTTFSLRWSMGSRAFRKRSPRCSRRPWCRPASCKRMHWNTYLRMRARGRGHRWASRPRPERPCCTVETRR
jgi:hypothetical protein